jgi:hypothetical protein
MTCKTCIHLGPMDECPALFKAVYVETKDHGWDGWSEVVGISVDDPEDFHCALYEAKDVEVPDAPKKIKIRGIDFLCEECETLSGSFLENGFYRCSKCGYPGQ